jgi:hypothetical protein
MCCLVAIPFNFPELACGASPARRVLSFRYGLMESGQEGVPHAKELRDLARQAQRLLHKEAREPPDGDLRDFRTALRRIDSLRRQLAPERRADLLRRLERLGQQVEGRRPIPSRSIASR